MVSMWVPKVCRNGALESQILEQLGVLRVCLHSGTEICIQKKEIADPREDWVAMRVAIVSSWLLKVCRNGALKSQILYLFGVLSVDLHKCLEFPFPNTTNTSYEGICVR